MSFLQNQYHILFGCGIFCIYLAIFTCVIRFRSTKKKMALIKIELGASFMLICDCQTHIFNGNTSSYGMWILKIGYFLIYLFALLEIYFLTEYLTAVFMESGYFNRLPKRLLLGYIIPSVAITLLLLNTITHWYYSIDANNIYHREKFFYIGVSIPFITLLLLLSFVLNHYKMMNRRIFWSIVIFCVLPIAGILFQIHTYGISTINLSIFISIATLYICVLSDQNEALTTAAYFDVSTGLPNTDGYIYEIGKIVHFQNITNYCGYYFDIVRMSHINNKYGKKIGDTVIKQYAYTIRNTIEQDEIIGRLGGNYFVALIKKENTEEFLELISDIPIEVEFEGRKEIIHISAIAGGYEILSKNTSPGQILSNTATAVSYAKNVAHKPYVFLDEELEKELKRIQQLEAEARKALKNKEFVPYYQPKIDARTNCIVGAEALVRWIREDQIVNPSDFIPVMENIGSVCELDFYILNAVCSDLRDWLNRGLKPVTISVNFSRRNLGNPTLAEDISKTVEKYNIPKEYVQIEITETLDEFPDYYLLGVIDALHRYGLTVAIDDFGTGSSSIGLLKEAHFDVLKIDKFFVDYKTDKEQHLLEDIIHMADHIGLSVVAEGVESMEQVSILKEMKCYVIQGFVYDVAIPKESFEIKYFHS